MAQRTPKRAPQRIRRHPRSSTKRRPTPPPENTEQFLRLLFDNARDAIAAFTLDGAITNVNPAAERLLGYTRKELVGQHYRTVATPASVKLAAERERRVLAGEKIRSPIFKVELLHKDGTPVPVEACTWVIRDPHGKPLGFQGIYRDLRERQQLQIALQESQADRQQSEDRYRRIFENSLDLIYLTDNTGRLLDANPALLQWAGYSLDELTQKHFLDFFAGTNRDELLHKFAELTQGKSVFGLRVDAKNAAGQVRTYEINASPLRDAQGTMTAVLSLARDMTARLEMEQVLRESQRLRERIADMLPDLVYVYDLDAQRMRLVNRQVSTMLGYTPEVVQGTSGPPFGEFLHPDDVAAQKARVQEFSTAAQDEFLTSEYRVRHVDGAYRWLQSRETVFTRTPEGRPQEILGYAVDITEQKRLSTMLQQQTLDPKEMGRRLKMFREGLNMTQAEFGRYLGEFDQERISTYERGVATIPIALILAIRTKGHPFEAVLGTGPAAVLHHTAQYLRRTHQDRVLTRELLRLTLELVQKDCARIEQALQGSQQEQEELSQTQKKLLQQLANLEEH